MILDAGFSLLDSGCQIPDAGCRIYLSHWYLESLPDVRQQDGVPRIPLPSSAQQPVAIEWQFLGGVLHVFLVQEWRFPMRMTGVLVLTSGRMTKILPFYWGINTIFFLFKPLKTFSREVSFSLFYLTGNWN